MLAVATLTPVPTATPTLTPTSTPTSVPGTRTIAVDHYLFITHPNDGLKIYDISDPSHPQLVYSISGSRRIYIKDHYLYMVDGQGMLYVDDIHDPGIPKELCRRQTGGEANGIDGTGNYVLVADGQNGVAVFDIAMVNDICLKDRLQTRGNARDVRIAANEKRVYVIWPDGSQWSFDISRYLDSPTLGDGGYATPNPFLPLLGQKAFFNFRFEEPNAVYAVRIYNLRGRLQRTLTNTREWDGRNESGHLCEGGVYVYQIEAEGKRVNGKVVLLK